MRFSDAINLGSTTCKMIAGDWDSCAVGGALNALGVPAEECLPSGKNRSGIAREIWPWTNGDRPGRSCSYLCHIWDLFDEEVCRGQMTLEQLVDYVRSIEPDCDCCRFGCDCKAKQETATEVEHVTA